MPKTSREFLWVSAEPTVGIRARGVGVSRSLFRVFALPWTSPELSAKCIARCRACPPRPQRAYPMASRRVCGRTEDMEFYDTQQGSSKSSIGSCLRLHNSRRQKVVFLLGGDTLVPLHWQSFRFEGMSESLRRRSTAKITVVTGVFFSSSGKRKVPFRYAHETFAPFP